MGSFKKHHNSTGSSLSSGVGQPRSSDNRMNNRKVKKKIMFDTSANKVRFVRVPPRSRNKEYWFTETQRIVKKGLQFEIEPEINTAINVDCRVQLSTIAMSAEASSSPRAQQHAGGNRLLRGVVSVLDEEGNLFQMMQLASAHPSGAVKPPKHQWLAVGSVRPGEMTSLKVILPRGVYQIRCEGPSPIQVFGQAWDVERELQ